MPRMGRTLASRILVAVLGIMAVTMALGLALFTRVTSRATDQQAVEQTAASPWHWATCRRWRPGRGR